MSKSLAVRLTATFVTPRFDISNCSSMKALTSARNSFLGARESKTLEYGCQSWMREKGTDEKVEREYMRVWVFVNKVWVYVRVCHINMTMIVWV